MAWQVERIRLRNLLTSVPLPRLAASSALWRIAAMSVIGTKQTSISMLSMSAFGGKADMTRTRQYVR